MKSAFHFFFWYFTSGFIAYKQVFCLTVKIIWTVLHKVLGKKRQGKIAEREGTDLGIEVETVYLQINFGPPKMFRQSLSKELLVTKKSILSTEHFFLFEWRLHFFFFTLSTQTHTIFLKKNVFYILYRSFFVWVVCCFQRFQRVPFWKTWATLPPFSTSFSIHIDRHIFKIRTWKQLNN